MDIAIIGSHGVGKKDLFELIVKELGVEFASVEDISLSEVKNSEDFFSNMWAQENILAERIYNIQWGEEHNAKNVINSGTVISDLAYLIIGDYSTYEFSFPGNITDNVTMLKALSPIVMKGLDHFHDHDLLFYVPIECEYDKYSIQKQPSKEHIHQMKIDLIIMFLLSKYNVKYVTVRGNVEERKDIILKAVRKFQKFGM